MVSAERGPEDVCVLGDGPAGKVPEQVGLETPNGRVTHGSGRPSGCKHQSACTPSKAGKPPESVRKKEKKSPPCVFKWYGSSISLKM